MIIRCILIGMLCIFTLGGLAPVSGQAAAKKPRPPLEVSVLQEGSSVASDRTLMVTVRANADVPEWYAVVEIKDGAEMIAGDARWEGSLKKNDQHTFKITVRQSKQGRGIVRTVATIPGPMGPAYTAQAEYRLSGKTGQQKRPIARQETMRKDRRGKGVVEHPNP